VEATLSSDRFGISPHHSEWRGPINSGTGHQSHRAAHLQIGLSPTDHLSKKLNLRAHPPLLPLDLKTKLNATLSSSDPMPMRNQHLVIEIFKGNDRLFK
jgi:hypothetical protein